MKLKHEFVIKKIGGHFFAVCVTSSAASQQMIKLNETGAFLFEQCKKSFDRETLTNALLKEYDADRALIEKDVDRFIDSLRQNELIDEE